MLCCVVLLYVVFMTSPPRETGVNIGLVFVQTRQTVPDHIAIYIYCTNSILENRCSCSDCNISILSCVKSLRSHFNVGVFCTNLIKRFCGTLKHPPCVIFLMETLSNPLLHL